MVKRWRHRPQKARIGTVSWTARGDDACGGVVGTLDEAVLAAGCLVWTECRVDTGRGRARCIVGCMYPTVVPIQYYRCVLLYATSCSGAL